MPGIMRRKGEQHLKNAGSADNAGEYKGGVLRAKGQSRGNLTLGETAEYAAKKAGIEFLRVGGGAIDAALVPVDLVTGNVEKAKSRFLNNPMDEKREALEKEYAPGKAGQVVGDIAGGIGQSIGYGLISAIPYAGKPMMYSSIVEQSISSAAQQTGDVGLKEIAYGATAGAVEGLLESKLGAGVNAAKGIGSAILKKTGLNVAESAAKAGGKSMLKSVLTETAKGFAGEFAEEAISEAVDPALLQLYNIDENAQLSMKDVAYAGLIGGLSGGIMSAGPAAINYRSAVSTGRALQESRLDGELIKRARYTLSALEAAQTRSARQIKGKPEGDAKETAKERLSRTSENRRVKRLSKETAQLADKIRRNIQAYENSMKDPAMAQSEPVAAILGELRGNLFLVGYSYEADVIEQVMMAADDKQRQAFVDAINEELAAQGKKHDYTLADFDANKDDIRRGLAGRLMLDELQGDTAEYGAEATEKPAQAATSPWDGMADNEDMSGYKATGEAENDLLRAAVNQSVPRGSVQAMLDEYRKGTDLTPEEFAAGWSDGAHIYGRYGLNVDEASPLSRMSPEAREAAMKFGRETEEAERKAAEEKAKAKKKPAEQAGKKGTVVRGEGLNVQKLSDEQYAAYKAAEVLAEVLGTDIKIETKVLTNKGKEANGYYDRGDNTIHININALRNGKNVALYTLGHEITHYIKEWSPRKFEALADFVLEQMGVDAETAIADKLASLKRLGIVKDTMTVAEANAMAREELVAEGMELVLTDGKVLEELAKTDKSLWEKIRDWFFDIIGQIRRSYESLNQASKTAQVLKETVESLEEIERLFTEGVREAGERTRTAEIGEVVQGEGDVVYHLRDAILTLGEYDSTRRRHIESSDRDRIVRNYDEIRTFIQDAPNKKEFERIHIGIINPETADLVLRKTGQDIREYDVVLSNEFIAHIFRQHGNQRTETPRNQIAVTTRNIEDLVEAMIAPDDVKADVADTGPALKFEKTVGNTNVALTITSKKKGTLTLKSAWIIEKSGGRTPSSNADALENTPETNSRSSTEGSITQFDDSVKTSTENSPENIYDTKGGVMIDTDTGTAMFSIDDIPKTEQEIDDAVNRLVAKLGVDESRARQWVQNELSLATLILRDDMVDYAHRKADRRLTAIVKNSDYKQGTLDFSNICRKRREYTRMMQRIQQAFPNRRFTAEEFATIRKIMVDEGLEVACGLCYVEDRRQNEGYIAETFQRAVEAWKKGNRDTYYDTKNNVENAYNKGQAKAMAMLEDGDYVPTIADLTTVEGMNKLQAEHKDILQAWKAFNNARGMSSARLLTNEAEYQRQILKYNKARVKAINDLGGLRVFSFSDFEEFHLLDIVQAVQDCAAMGIKIQFYTKVPSFALLMAGTKAKGNLSLIPKGDLGYEIRNGKRVLVYDPVEGIDFNNPDFKKVARGNPNIGTILVGINDEHIRTAMEDDNIDYIIPFHTGQTEVVRQIKKIGKWKNYKNEQVDKPWDSGSKAKPVNVYTDVIATAERERDPIRNERQFVERFLKVCEERGLRPRFSGFLNTNAEGKYVYTKGYYKLLLDFKMFDKDGTYLPQEPVIPDFDADLLHELTEKYVAGEKAKTEAESPAFKRALERVEAEVVGDDEGRMYSIDETHENADVSENRDLTDREILGMALEGAVQNEDEWKIVKFYREQAAMLELAREKRDGYIKEANALERQIKALRARMEDEGDPDGWIRKAMDDAIAKKREAERMRDEQVKILDNADRELLRMKAAKPFREIVDREQKRVRAAERRAERAEEVADRKVERARESAEKKITREKERMEEQSKQSRERKEITIRMREARRVLGYLNTMLYHPTKQKHVPESLQALVEKALRSAEPKQFGINRDNIREMADLAGKIAQLESKAGKTATEQERLDKMKSRYEHLEADTLSVKRQAEALYTAFEQYVTTTTDAKFLDKDLLEGLRQTVTEIDEAPLTEMTLKSLTAVENIYTTIKHQVDHANETFATEKAVKIDELGTKANTEVKNNKPLKIFSPKAGDWVGKAAARQYLWKNLKPLTAFEVIGSNEFTTLFRNVLDAEDVWITDIMEAKEFLDKAKKEYGFNKWDLNARTEVTTADGSKVSLTLGEKMSLFAYMFREQAEEHLSAGGFVFAPDAKSIARFKGAAAYETHLNDQTPHRMRKEDIAKMSESLTAEQRAYAEAVQKYLTSLGEKGNKVSEKLYGIKLFNEKAYFPIKSSHDYLQAQTGRSGDPNIKSRGTFKETVPKAGNPIVLQDFMEVTADHVNTMAIYHAFVLPVEDLTRVWNYTPVNIKRDEEGRAILDKNGMPVADTEGEAGYNSLKAEITKKYGKEANDYILQMLRDLNGGARRDTAASMLDKGLTAFKRSATMMSLSTVIQQPTSIFRAMAYVDAKYFAGAKLFDWDTVKKYAPVAAIKDMGGFDVGVGSRTTEFINARQYDSKSEKIKAMLKPEAYGGDPQARAEAFGRLPGLADEITWRYMFGAIVNEQAAKLGKPADSEAVLKAAGERFTDVVRRTQVYDSTLTRSEYMRSKDTGAKLLTQFAAEPTTVVSMIVDGLIKAERGDKSFFKKTAAAVAASIIINAMASSLIYAMRDDDEEKNILEKYVSSLTGELIEGFNPLEYLPFFRDIMSIFKGYDVERSDMTLIGNLFDQIELITSSKRSFADKLFGVTGAVTAFFGIPVTNVYRDVKGVINTGASFVDSEPVTGRGLSGAVNEGVKSQYSLIYKLFGAQNGNAYELYKAASSGDIAHYDRVAARYASASAAEQALRKELRENDRRIYQAAEAKLSGDLDVYESIVDQIEAEGHFDRNLVIRAVNNEVLEIKDAASAAIAPKTDDAEEAEEEAAEALYTATDLADAMERGDTDDFKTVYDYLISRKTEQGQTEAQAKSAVRSSVTAKYKRLYLAAWEQNNTAEMKRILELLRASGLYGTYNDTAKTVEKWVRESKS